MKPFALATLLSLLIGGVVHAAAIELPAPAHTHRIGNPILVPRTDIVAPTTSMSELPEPEVFAMMLVGLILIGYRASHHSSEKFK